jgi:hypothetical protein
MAIIYKNVSMCFANTRLYLPEFVSYFCSLLK